ncbi:chemotaxis protein CheB [Solirubrobacter sp. CPCC 204708]|uniref:protein-glutamate methylesterase n=1 Tax=Solirubrobacter deserti TaxID=2282478 RepID=A0ABT4RR13_9ACTN|nr:chemotaxis protein CheB [Solirubrobacter deserti]MBE2320076.1 chemotaxis protein CheB [Solirubrobacter deserti]MDA0140984.1 chemotaxis protein CheB [Solirubrobacter deserti]
MGHTLPSRVIGVAASAGGVEALRTVVSALPADFDAAVCIVLHIPPTGRSLLAPILDRDTVLSAVVAEHGMALWPGSIYVAPADHHLLVREDRVELSRGPKENGSRPAADPLFRSIARAWGERGAAVVLSGALDDGAAGAVAVKLGGGEVLVQHPEDALVPGMPSAALAATTPDAVLPIRALADRLAATRVEVETEETPESPEPDPAEVLDGPIRPEGPATGFTCPECSGALWELREGELVRYRGRVGHAYSEEARVEAQGSSVEAALWTALEVLEERAELLQRLAGRATTHQRTRTSFAAGAREAAERAAIIRRVLAAEHEPAA